MRGKKQFPPKIQFVVFSASDFLWVAPDFLRTSQTPRLRLCLEPRQDAGRFSSPGSAKTSEVGSAVRSSQDALPTVSV